jgi:hypothetical protein
LKAGLLAFGTLILAAPVPAQPSSDPLAPLPGQQAPTQPKPVVVTPPPATTQAPIAAVTQPVPAPAPVVAAPRDWRGVFDAIDSGNWASARAGIAALPPSILTPVAKAEPLAV